MINSETTVEDIMINPKVFGLPTFEEFAKNPDKYRGRDDEIMGLVEHGSISMGHLVRKQKYFFRPVIAGIVGEPIPCKNLEEVESRANDHGVSLVELKVSPRVVEEGGGKYCIEVTFAKGVGF